MKIPDGVSDEDAASFPVSITTSAMALFMELGLPFIDEPAKEPITILVYGGSTSTGAMATQLAKW